MRWILLIILGVTISLSAFTPVNSDTDRAGLIIIGLACIIFGIVKEIDRRELKKEQALLDERSKKREAASQARKIAERRKAEEGYVRKESKRRQNSKEEWDWSKCSKQLFMSWESKPWANKTKTVCRIIQVQIYGLHNSNTDDWISMTLQFNIEKQHYEDRIYISQCADLKSKKINQLLLDQKIIAMGQEGNVFFYDGDWYFLGEEINVNDAIFLIDAAKKRQREKLDREIERAKNILEKEQAAPNRRRIPENIQSFVWNRDKGMCVKCGSKEKLEFDHIIPLSKGGSNTARNLQLLCEECNRQKGNRI